MSNKTNNLNDIAKALFIVNRHAKTAPNPRPLYDMKKQAINKLLRENHAEKVGLHFSDRPKLSRQHSTLLVKVSDFYFHIPPAKQDFQEVKHLGATDKNFRNPKPQMSLTQAKKILSSYLGWSFPEKKETDRKQPSSYYTPSSLGQWERKPRRKQKKY
ncbi:YkyB family protein [Sediminibacillus halophilus]|uniref:YkyB-like protein n=1 Tax=Sediminibacillus halophilus TaxID=482461 RepID=A0A1G9MYL9_9BACI|nr:YkyB family protein [Sediminibacillus halophilus]SDL79372.1 YkyB-like protein [Sediminibacillus halophilus]